MSGPNKLECLSSPSLSSLVQWNISLFGPFISYEENEVLWKLANILLFILHSFDTLKFKIGLARGGTIAVGQLTTHHEIEDSNLAAIFATGCIKIDSIHNTSFFCVFDLWMGPLR